jgi:hypothetical protein
MHHAGVIGASSRQLHKDLSSLFYRRFPLLYVSNEICPPFPRTDCPALPGGTRQNLYLIYLIEGGEDATVIKVSFPLFGPRLSLRFDEAAVKADRNPSTFI